jgi:hypothetical protein
MRALISRLGHPLAMRSSACVSQAWGSTLFILTVARRLAIAAHVRLPPSEPAKSEFLRLIV